ncbi:unnamed protein product, partial [Brassica oleracea var. botrytis]
VELKYFNLFEAAKEDEWLGHYCLYIVYFLSTPEYSCVTVSTMRLTSRPILRMSKMRLIPSDVY